MPVGRGLRGLNWNSVLAENVDGRAADRFARFNRNQEDVAAVAGAFLGDNANVGDEQEPAVFDVADRFLLLRVPTARAQKEKAALASAIGGFLQLFGKIECGIVRLPFVLNRDWLVLNRDARNIFLT